MITGNCPVKNSKYKKFESRIGNEAEALELWRKDEKIPSEETIKDYLNTRNLSKIQPTIEAETAPSPVEVATSSLDKLPLSRFKAIEDYINDLDSDEAFQTLADIYRVRLEDRDVVELIEENDWNPEYANLLINSDSEINRQGIRALLKDYKRQKRILDRLEKTPDKIELYGVAMSTSDISEIIEGARAALLTNPEFGIGLSANSIYRAVTDKKYVSQAIAEAVDYTLSMLSFSGISDKVIDAISQGYINDPSELNDPIINDLGIEYESKNEDSKIEDTIDEDGLEDGDFEGDNSIRPEAITIDPETRVSNAISLFLSSFVVRNPKSSTIKQSPRFKLRTLENKSKLFAILINTISGKTPTRKRALEVLKIEASKNEVVKELLTRLESPEFTPDFNQIYDTTFDNYASLNRESTKLRFQNEFHASFQNTIHRLKELNLSKKGIYFKDLNEMSTKRFMASDYKSQTDVYEKETSAFEDFKTSTDTVLGVNTIEDMLGVTFYKEVLNELLNEQTVSSLLKNHLISFRQYLNSEKGKQAKLSDVYDFKPKGADSNIFDFIFRESAKIEKDTKLSVTKSDGKLIHPKNLHSTYSIIHDTISDIQNQFKDAADGNRLDSEKLKAAIREELPFLFTNFNDHSLVLNQMLAREIEYTNTLGVKSKGTSTDFRRLDESANFHLIIIGTLTGVIPNIKQGDRGIKYDTRFKDGNPLLPVKSSEEAVEAAIAYFKDQIEFADLNEVVNPALEDIRTWTKTHSNHTSKENLDSNINAYVNDTVEASYKFADDNGLTAPKLYPSILQEEYGGIESMIKTGIINHMIGVFEQQHYLYGDFSNFDKKGNNSSDFNKISAGISSSGSLFQLDANTNSFVNEFDNLFKLPDGSTYYEGNEKHPRYLKSLTFTTDDVASSMIEDRTLEDGTKLIGLRTLFTEELQNNSPGKDVSQEVDNMISYFKNIEEPDGGSWINPIAYFNLKIRRGEVGEAALRNYTYERAVLDSILKDESISKNKRALVMEEILNQDFPEGTDIKKEKKLSDFYKKAFTADSFEKLQYFGPKYSQIPNTKDPNIPMVMMLQKSGTSVIKPSVAANFPMQKAMLKYMINNRIDAIYHITSTKSGVKNPQNVYNSDGSLNPEIEDSSYYMDLKYLKTQIQMPANGKEKSTVSTQARNLLASYLPEEVIKNFDELQVQNIKNRLLSTYYKYGLTDTNVENFRALTTDLADQAKNAGHSDNVVRAIRNFNPNEFFIESLPNHNLIDSNTHAFLRKTLIKETRSGISAYQVSSTFWEKANRDVNANNESALKWYSLKEDGTLTPAETIIPLPWEIVDGISKATGETNLERIVDIANRGDKYKFEFWSARIPGQSKASLDWYKVKTFISPLMQNMQVVPTETIAKNGSDFDGDKSFNYFPEFDSKGLVDAEHSNTILNRAEIEMLAHPDSRLLLFEPVGVEPLIEAKEQSLSDEQKTLVDRPTFADLMKPETTAFNSWIFLSTKDGTGAMANFIKAAIIGNKYGLKLKESVTMIDPISEEEITLDQKLPFEGDNLDLSTSFNGDGRTKSSELSVGITSQVDGIKSPYAALLNLTGDGLNIAGYLLMRGVSIPTVAAFLTQPIITEFLKNERKRKGPLAKFIGGRELKTIKVESSQDIKQRLMSGLAYLTATEVLPKTLGAENLTYLANNNKNQQELLSLFLRVQDLANLFRPVIQYISADTSKLSRFTQTYDFFRDVVEVIKDPGNRINPLENPEILMENNTMTGAFISARERFYAPFLNWHISNQSVTENIVEALLNKYTSGFTPSKIKTETRTKLTDLLVKYIVQNFNSEFRGKFESAINEAGEMISNIKRDAAHPLNNNSFISRVVIDSSDGYMAPKLKTRANNAVESRALVNGVIEIKDKKPELYEALAMVIPFLPTVSSSLYNLEPFMPFEKLFSTQSIVKQVIRPAVDTSGFIPAKFAINIGNAIRTLEAAYPKMLPQEWERGRRGRDNDRNKLYYNSDTQEVVDYDGNPVKPRAGFSYLNLLAENVASEVPVKASTNYLQATRKSNSALAEKITSSIYSPEIKVNELTGQTMDRLDGAGWVKAAATLILLANEDMPSTQVYDTLMTLEPNENYKTLGWYATIFSSLNAYKNAAPVFRKIVLNQLPSRADFEIDPSHVIDKLLSYGVITANPRSGSYEVSNGGIPYTLNTNESLDESNVENEAPLLAENLKTLKAVSARYGNALSLIGRQGSTILTTNFNQLNENNKDELTNKCNII